MDQNGQGPIWLWAEMTRNQILIGTMVVHVSSALPVDGIKRVNDVNNQLQGLLFCLGWGLKSQSTIFQSCRDGATASWVIITRAVDLDLLQDIFYFVYLCIY